jgi:serine/threonine-protein kinase
MNGAAWTGGAPPSPSGAGRLEQACDRFEAAWRAGERPRIEDYWSVAAGSGSPALLRELLVVELAYRHRRGESPRLEEYRARIPGQDDAIRAAFDACLTPRAAVALPAEGRPRGDAERGLLFGVLALQMGFVSRDALIAAVGAWALEKSTPLDRVLVARGALAPDERDLLEPLIEKHLSRHDGDPERSLAAVGMPPAALGPLGLIAAPELQASVTRLVTPREHDDGPATALSVGTPTSSGGRFRVLRLLDRGGLGEVYVAVDEELHREVALKAIQDERAADPDSRTRFLLEAEVTGRLEHPGVVPVYGLGQDDDGRPYYAMRLIRGESLKEAVARFHEAERPGRDAAERELAFRALLGRFIDVCNAVAFAHSRGVLHRDLKPGNIMLGPYGETLVVDWGLAKAAGRADSTPRALDGTLRPEAAAGLDSTLPDARLGTPAYMSPEQAAGRVDLHGTASDVYSLGATLYHLLTGRAPFEGTDVFTTLRKVQQGDFPAPRAVNGRVPGPLDAVCRKAMALRIDDRYPSPRALADDIEHWLADEVVSAYRDRTAARLARWGRRHKPAAAAAAALLITAVVTLSVSTLLMGREATRREALRRLAETNFAHARDAVDRMLTEVAEVELADVPQMQAVRRRLLEKARSFYLRSLEQGRTDPAVRREAGRAHIRLGEIAGLLGDHVESERAYRQGLAILDDLLRDHTARLDVRRDLAQGHQGLGVLLKKANRFRESEAALRTALSLRERLSADHPDDAADRQALTDTRYHLAALVSRLQGRHPEDEAAYREVVRVQEELVASSRGNPGYRRKLARYLGNLGKLLASTGRLDEAEAAYREAVAVVEGLVATGPPAPGDRWLLAQCHANLALALRDGDRLDEAEAACLKARTLEESLRADFPDVPDYRHELASVLNNLGLIWTKKDPSRADLVLREALELQQALAAEFPRRPDYQLGLAVTRLNLAAVVERIDTREAERTYRDALAVHERLTADFPEVPEYRLDLGRTIYRLARLRLAGDDPGGSRALLTRAIGLHRSVLASDPQGLRGREFLRDDYAVLCMALIRSGAHEQAADAAAELPRIIPDGAREYLRAAAFLAQCAAAAAADTALTGSGRDERSEEYARRAVGLLRRASDGRWIKDPQELWIQELAPLWPRDDFQELKRRIEARSVPRAG